MEEKSKRDPIRKYYLGFIIATAIYFSLVFTILFFYAGIVSILAIVSLLYPYKFAIRKIADTTILPVLYVNLDAKGFENAVNSLLKKRNYNARIDYRMLIAVSSGNRQDAVNVAVNKLNSKKCPISWKYYFLYHLALVYFELRDFEKLRLIVEKFDEYDVIYQAKYRSSKNLRHMFDYYKAFLDSDYEKCKALCKNKISSLDPKKSETRYRTLNNILYYAVACYYNNEIALAKKNLEVVEKATPNLNISSVAREYLEAIENNCDVKIHSEVLPEIDFELYTKEHKKRARINKIIGIVWIALLVAYIVVTSIIDYAHYNDRKYIQQEIDEYEEKLNDAIADNYVNAEALAHFNVKKNGEVIEHFCIVGIKDRIDITTVVTYDGGETSDLIKLQRKAQIGEYYCVKSEVSPYYIGFKIYDEKKSPDDFYHVVEFTHNGSKYWFVIDYVEEMANK